MSLWALEVAAVRLLPAVGHPQAVVVSCPAPAWGVQYFLMKVRLIGGLMTLLGATGTP